MIRDGDILVTHCIYDSTSRNYTTCESRGSQDEMCIANMVYYPTEVEFSCHWLCPRGAAPPCTQTQEEYENEPAGICGYEPISCPRCS